jgi:hypothetical protein
VDHRLHDDLRHLSAGRRVTEPRDWNALLRRVLAPFSSEAAAFRVVVWIAAVFGAIIAIALIVKAL